MQLVREMVGFHGQDIDFEQLIRKKAGLSGQVVDFQSIVPRNRNGWGINARKQMHANDGNKQKGLAFFPVTFDFFEGFTSGFRN